MASTGSDDITIRPFDVHRDADRLRRIVGEVWAGGSGALMERQFGVIGGRPWDDRLADDILNYFKPNDAHAFVAEKDVHVVGFCSYVIDHDRRTGHVGYNAVAAGHQGQGVGSIMMGFVMDAIRAAGMEYASVLVADNEEHAPARRVYEKYGFHRLTGLHQLVQKL